MLPITNLNQNLSSDKVDKKKYKNKKYSDDNVSNVDDVDEYDDNDNGNGSDSDNDSDNDSEGSNDSNSDRILIAIKWIKSIINKNRTRKMNTSRLLNIIKDEIKTMKKTLFECKKCKNKKFIKELNEELAYYDELVVKLDKEYESDNNFDILKYIEKIEDEYRKSFEKLFENLAPNNITNFPELVFTILLGQNDEENNQTNQNVNYTDEEKNKDKEYNQEFDKLYNFDTTTKNTAKYFNHLELDNKKTIIEKLKEIKSEEHQLEPNFIKILNYNIFL